MEAEVLFEVETGGRDLGMVRGSIFSIKKPKKNIKLHEECFFEYSVFFVLNCHFSLLKFKHWEITYLFSIFKTFEINFCRTKPLIVFGCTNVKTYYKYNIVLILCCSYYVIWIWVFKKWHFKIISEEVFSVAPSIENDLLKMIEFRKNVLKRF